MAPGLRDGKVGVWVLRMIAAFGLALPTAISLHGTCQIATAYD